MFKKNDIDDSEILKLYKLNGSVRSVAKTLKVGGNRVSRVIKYLINATNVLVIGDTHLPYEHSGYLEHCIYVYKKFNCNKVVHIGDLLDQSALSFHEKDPDMPSGLDEYKLALEKLKCWKAAFPEMVICRGNHDELPSRKGRAGSIPEKFIKDLSDIYEFPSGWKFLDKYELDGVLYIHCPIASGKFPYANIPMITQVNTVIGHAHTIAGVYYSASENSLIWGMSVGCGIDWNSRAFNYQKNIIRKPIVSCGVVLDNGRFPIILPMKI
jgi:metallophosphoesterase superfamily enzyme